MISCRDAKSPQQQQQKKKQKFNHLIPPFLNFSSFFQLKIAMHAKTMQHKIII